MDEFIGKQYLATIDVKDKNLSTIDKGVQIFIGDSTKFHITLTDGKSVPKDLTNIIKVKAYYRRSDNTVVEQESNIEIINPLEGKIDVTLDKHIINVPNDKIQIAIRLIDTNELITSTSVTFKVVRAIDSDIVEDSNNSVATLEKLTQQIEKSEDAIIDIDADITDLNNKLVITNTRIDDILIETEKDVAILENRIDTVNQELDEQFLRITKLDKQIIDGKVCFVMSPKAIMNWVGRSFQISVVGSVDTSEIVNSCIVTMTICKNVNTSNKNVVKILYESKLDVALANNRVCGCQCVWKADNNDNSEIPSNYSVPISILIKTRFGEKFLTNCNAYISSLNY